MNGYMGGANLKVYSILAWRLNGIAAAAAAAGLFVGFWVTVLLGTESREIEAERQTSTFIFHPT